MRTFLHHLLRAACLAALLLPAAAVAQPGILDFYPYADSLSRTPPMINELTILGQKKVQGRFITIIGTPEDKSVMIAAVTLKPIKNLAQELSLSVRFRKSVPDVGPTATWGYIFDRNHDGKVDYMALVGGAAAYKDEGSDEIFRTQAGASLQTQVAYFIEHCRLVFNHWADDNYDGSLDAVIHIDMDPKRDFVDRQLVVRSTKFDGKFDDVWAFRASGAAPSDTILHTMTSVAYNAIGKGSDFISPSSLGEKSSIMHLIDDAVRKLKLTPKSFERFSTIP